MVTVVAISLFHKQFVYIYYSMQKTL